MATAALRSDAFAAQASINVTPLIDVLLVLLMILMLTTPLTTRRVPLPLGADEPGATPPPELQLALKPTGELYLDGVAVSRAELSAALATAAAAARPPLLDLRPDFTLARFVIATGELKARRYEAVERDLANLPADDFAGIGGNVLKAWALVGENHYGDATAVLDKIASLDEPDRTNAGRIHAIALETAPWLRPRLFYGSPAYADGDGKVLFFYQERAKFKVRYSTFGFQPDATIDDGVMWPVAFAVTELNPRVEARIVELVKRAAG